MHKSHQYAVLYAACRGPVEHASAVVFHLSLLKVKVLRLVVGNSNLQLAVFLLVRWLVGRPEIGFDLSESILETLICTLTNIQGGDQFLKALCNLCLKDVLYVDR